MRPARGGTVLLALPAGVLLAFLASPVVALLAEAPLGEVPSLLGEPVVRDMLGVTARTTAVANAVVLLLGTPTAYLLARRRFRGRALLVTLVELPVVLPPAVAGIGLLAAFGAGGLLGPQLAERGIVLAYGEWAVVLAVVFVSAPFYVRQAIPAFAGVPAAQHDAARDLGAGRWATFRRVTLPLAAGGLLSGWVLSFARGIGEFGATIMFAGSVRGETQTLTLGVYDQLGARFDIALAIGVLLLVLSGGVLGTAKFLLHRRGVA